MNSSLNSPLDETRNWKQEPLVWMLIAIPSSAIIMGIVMLTLAIQSYSGLVVDDYYKKGKQINRVLARDRFAYELGLAADLVVGQGNQLRIQFAPGVDVIPGDRIELSLVHATRPGLDQQLVLEKLGPKLFGASISVPGQGRWNLILQTADWRLTGSLQSPAESSAALTPNYFPQ